MPDTPDLAMPIAGLVVFIAIMGVAIADLFLVLIGRGAKHTVSSFLIRTVFKSPIVSFGFGTACGHLFFYVNDTDCTIDFGERMLVGACGAVVGSVLTLLLKRE